MKTIFLNAKDGEKLFVRIFEKAGAKANLILVHGLCDHSLRWQKVIDFFLSKNFNVVVYDKRGHGASSGKRIFLSSYKMLIDDLHEVVKYTRHKFKKKDVIIFGHSLGGMEALLLGTKFKRYVRGYVISSALSRNCNNLFKDVKINMPKTRKIEDVIQGGICNDEKELKKYYEDRNCYSYYRASMANEIKKAIKYLKKNTSFCDDILILHGKLDGIVSYQDAILLQRELASKNKKLLIYDLGMHELYYDTISNKVLEDVLNFVENLLE